MTRNSLLLSIAFAWAFAYLIVQHTLPVATFYGEWTAALMFALLACQLVFAAWVMKVAPAPHFVVSPSVWVFPKALLIPAALAVVLAVQAALGVGEQFWIGQLALLYALVGLAAVCLAGYLRQLLGLPTLLLTLAWSGLAVGLLGSVIEILQAFKLEPKLFTLISQTGYDAPRRLYGNLNQPNHQATMVSMGLAALVYLHCIASHASCFPSKENQQGGGAAETVSGLPKYQFTLLTLLYVVCVPVLLIGMALTGSRTAWVHLGLAVLMGLWLTFRSERPSAAQPPSAASHSSHRWMRVGLLLALPIVYWLIHVLLGWASEQWQLGLFNTLSKFKESAQTGARMALWQHAWAMFVAHPWLGIGWGDFSWQQYLQLERLAVVVEMANNGHNIVLDLLAKIGGIGTALVGLASLTWLWRVIKALKTDSTVDFSARLLALIWLAMLLAHSMLEFPLHYLYFWLACCFLLGAADPAGWVFPMAQRIGSKLLQGAALTVVFLSGATILMATWVDYRKAEALYYNDAIGSYESRPAKWWFSDFAQFGYVGTLPLGEVMSQQELERRHQMMEAAIRFNALPSQMHRAALYRAMLGKNAEAYALLRTMRWYYSYLPPDTDAKRMVELCNELDESQHPHGFCRAMSAWRDGKPLPKS